VKRSPVSRGEAVFLAVLLLAVVVVSLIVRDATGATSTASAYGPGLYGNRLACGGTLTPATRAIAHRWLKCGTPVRVCYGRRCTTARVRDRGPFVAGRTLDLTEAVVRRLGYRSARSWGVRVVAWHTTKGGRR
jgi:rare lipoprotein A (peptidoglycan hydrolase)